MKRGLALFLAALLTALTLTACGGGGGYSGGSASSAPADSESQTAYDDSGDEWKAEVREFGFDAPADAAGGSPAEPGATTEEPREDRLASAKMVYTASIQAETQDYDACTAALEELVDRLGGYLECASSDSYGDGSRSASYTVRVPAKEFRGFLKTVGEISHVTSQDQNAENISERYYDTESRLETQKTKMERLQTLLSKAENMEDIIDLENAISETEYHILPKAQAPFWACSRHLTGVRPPKPPGPGSRSNTRRRRLPPGGASASQYPKIMPRRISAREWAPHMAMASASSAFSLST